MMYVSEDGRRMLDDDPPLVAAAAYEMNPDDSRDVSYHHVGSFDDEERALRWLESGNPDDAPTRVFVGGKRR